MHSGAAFESTQWSMVLAAPGDPTMLDRLCRRYIEPIYAYIRKAGQSPDRAEDLAQEFIATVVLERKLIERADPERGRFRTFIRAALSNFLIDQHRRAMSTKRTPRNGTAPAQGADLDELLVDATRRAAEDFDREWAAKIVGTALERVEAGCIADGQPGHWEAFSTVFMTPLLRHTKPPPIADVAERLGVEPGQVSSMIQTGRRRFRREARRLIRETVADPATTEDELRELLALL